MSNSTDLFTCPRCKTTNFTKRGLTSHVCRKNGRKPLPKEEVSATQRQGASPSKPVESKALRVVTLSTLENLGPLRAPNPDAEMGEQLTAQYERATGGMVEVLKFGCMFMQARAEIDAARGVDSARGVNSAKRGPTTKGTGFKGWLKEHAPKIKEQTAYRLLSITESIAEEYEKIVGAKIAKDLSMCALVTLPAEALTEQAAAKQLELFNYVKGTSGRSWLDRFTNETNRKGPGGNNHPQCPHCSADLKSKTQAVCPKCHRPTGLVALTPEQQLSELKIKLDEWITAQISDPILANRTWRVGKKHNALALAAHYREAARKIEEWFAMPDKRREELSMDELLGGAK